MDYLNIHLLKNIGETAYYMKAFLKNNAWTYFQMISTSLHFPEKINDNNEYTENDDNKYIDPRIKILEFLRIIAKNF